MCDVTPPALHHTCLILHLAINLANKCSQHTECPVPTMPSHNFCLSYPLPAFCLPHFVALVSNLPCLRRAPCHSLIAIISLLHVYFSHHPMSHCSLNGCPGPVSCAMADFACTVSACLSCCSFFAHVLLWECTSQLHLPVSDSCNCLAAFSCLSFSHHHISPCSVHGTPSPASCFTGQLCVYLPDPVPVWVCLFVAILS